MSRLAFLGLLLIAVGLPLAVAATFGARRTNATTPPVTYCAPAPTLTIPKCPPEPGTVVAGHWLDGSLATLTWTGREWQLRVPGGERKRVTPPHDWEAP